MTPSTVSHAWSGTNPAATVMKAGYRADGLRAWKEKSNGERVYFLYDGEQLLCEVDGSGTDAGEVRATSWWGADGLISRSYSPAGGGGYDRSYVWDTKGNIALQRGGGGSILQRTGGDAFGATGGSSDEPVATFAGQVGGYRDSETGLILFGQRYYEPGTGSWITRDPIAEAGGINLYSYVTGNPTNFVDPDGLFRVSKGFAKKYPKSTKLINSLKGNLTKAKYDAFKKYGQANKSKVNRAFTNGKGPSIVSAKLPSDVNGEFVYGKGSSVLRINENLLKAYEKGKASSRYLSSTIEHECTHFFDDADKADYPAEEGTEYEKKVYGKNIGQGGPKWED